MSNFNHSQEPTLRTPASVARKRAYILNQMVTEEQHVGARPRAVKRARRAGVLLDPNLRCGYEPTTLDDSNWIFGPHREKDNIYQAVPQVTLHGFEEDLVQKLNHGAFESVIKFYMDAHHTPAAEVIPHYILHMFAYMSHFY